MFSFILHALVMCVCAGVSFYKCVCVCVRLSRLTFCALATEIVFLALLFPIQSVATAKVYIFTIYITIYTYYIQYSIPIYNI